MKLRVLALLAVGTLLAAMGGSSATAAGRTASSNRAPSKAAKASHVAAVSGGQHIGAVLYDQNDDPNDVSISSQNFEAVNDPFDDAAADDFTVPAGTKWIVKTVSVTGFYSAAGPATSETVTFYKNAGGLPGALVKTVTATGIDTAGSFVINVGKVKLRAGHYWVSVVANMDFDPNGQWYWTSRNTQAGIGAVWQNPGDGFATGCTTYTDWDTCIVAGQGQDAMFALSGSAR